MEWVVTMRNHGDGLLFRDYFEGPSIEWVKDAAERFYVNADFVDACPADEDFSN